MLQPCCKLSSKVLPRLKHQAHSTFQFNKLLISNVLMSMHTGFAGLLQEHKQLPDKMLQLMPLLENYGKKFADKSLISISGAHCDARCL